MQEFEYNGTVVEFWKIVGEVLGSQKHSETRVTSSGGGGHMNQGTGYVSAPVVSSHTILHHDFWLKTPEGREVPIQLTGVDIPLREAQKITVIAAKNKKKEKGRYAVLVNHSAGRHWLLDQTRNLNEAFEVEKVTNKSAALTFAVFCLGGSLGGEVLYGIAAAVPYGLWRVVRKKRRRAKADSQLNVHLEMLAKAEFAAT